MSKERRRKQFEGLVTNMYSEAAPAGERGHEQTVNEKKLKKLIKWLTAGSSQFDVTVLDKPENRDGLVALRKALEEFGVKVEEVPQTFLDSLGED